MYINLHLLIFSYRTGGIRLNENTDNLYSDMNFFDFIIHSVTKKEVLKKDIFALNRILKSLRDDLTKSYGKSNDYF